MQQFKILVCLILLGIVQKAYCQYAAGFSKSEQIIIEQSLLNNPSYHSAFAAASFETDTSLRKTKIFPLINSNFGFSTKQNTIYSLSPGVYAWIPMGPKVSLWVAPVMHYEKYPYFIASGIDSNQILPEGGVGHSANNHDFYGFRLLGELSYSPIKYCKFDGGYGKKHWGEGYRSLWLSDYSAYYPYLQLRVHFWRIQYHILWAYLKDIDSQAAGRKFLDKYGVFHFFDFKPTGRLSLGFFESVIWWGKDANTWRGVDPAYLNPIIFFRPVEYSLHSPDNANLGIHASLLLGKSTRLYHQLFIDDLSIKKIWQQPLWWGNKYGILAGIKMYQLFGLSGLFGQLEYSRVRPFTYAHSSSALNYGTYYQPLGHPLGANFEEYLLILRYRKGPWSIFAKTSIADQGRDSLPNQNVGKNIYLSYLNRQTSHDEAAFLQGDLYRMMFVDFRVYRSLSKRIPLHGFAGIQYRTDKGRSKSITETIIRLGITAGFFNDERDY